MPRISGPIRHAASPTTEPPAIVDAAAPGTGARPKRRAKSVPPASEVGFANAATPAVLLSGIASPSPAGLADAGSAFEAAAPAPPSPPSPAGKLGLLLAHLGAPSGATMADLTALTDWQPHTVRAALSRLRARGFPIQLAIEEGRKTYRLARKEG